MSLLHKSQIKGRNPGEVHENGNDHPVNGNWNLADKSLLLLNSVPSAIVYIDKTQHFQYANKAFENIFGVDAKKLLGKPVAEFLGAEANNAVKKYRELVLSGQPAFFEMEVPFLDTSRYIEATYTPDWDANGNIAGYVLVINDISTQKDASRALKESEKRNKEIVESLPVALYTCDKNGYITLSNKAADELWGRKPDCHKDKWCGSWKIFEPDGITALPLDTCPMAMAVKTGKPVYGKEIIIERPDGTRRNVQPYPTPLFDQDGKIAGAVNMLLDITDIKISENQSAQLAAIVHSSHDPIISKTLNGIITSWNEAAERVFGYTPEEMIGQPVTKLIPPDRLNEEVLILERLNKGEKVEHFETKRIAKNNQVLDILLTISPIKNSSGKVIGASKIAKDITEQKKLFESLRESEERFRMAIESTRLGTWEFLPSSGSLNWSGECRKIYDVPDDIEIDYDLFVKHIHPEDAGWVQRKIEEAMDPAGNGKYDIKYRILRFSDKQPRWIRAQGQVYFNEKGKPERFIGTVLDISEEMKFEMALKENVELFTTLVDNVPAMIWMSGEDKFNDYFNKTWLAFTGRTAEQESKEGWLENVHPDDVQKCIDGYSKAFNEQKGFYTEYRLRHHSGEYRWIADNAVARNNPDGSFAGFVSACIDINDQKNFREKILKSELLLKTISNAAPVGLWLTDEQARNTFVNDTWVEWSGIPCEDQQGSGWLNCVYEEDRSTVTEKFAECLLKKEKYSAEFRINRPGGEIRWCLTEGSPYYNMDGEFAGYAGSVTDITDMKKMEERKDDFIKMASHELKTPITSIKGYVQLLLNIYEELSEEKFQASRGTVKSSLHTIAKQVTKLTRLVTELLDLSRIESGKLELHKTTFDLSDLLEETAEDVRLTTSKHAIIVHNDFEGNIYADKERIAQVLLNLLTNAIKYSPDSDCVEICAEQRNNKAIIKVKDKGIGIDEKDHERIFERFYRVEGRSEQTYPGFGIGLFIANEILQRHNGVIYVESKKGKGSEFTVELPVGI